MMAEVKFYAALVLRRLPMLIVLVMLCTAAGVLQAVRLPATYEARARLLYEGPIVEDTRDDFQAGAEIQIIQEQLLTRPNLLEIAEEFEVFEDYSSMQPDRIVAGMRDSSSISNRGGRNQATVITVSFSARSGQIAADVVNEYVTRIISSSAERRRDFGENNLDFFESEVDQLSSELSRMSAELSAFQAENADALPEDQNFRLSRQATLQERLASAQRISSSLVDQRARLIQVYDETGGVAIPDAVLSDDERQLQNLERELAEALTVYSETAPRIVTLRRRIDQLRDLVAQNRTGSPEISPSRLILQNQLDQIDDEIAENEAIIAETQAGLGVLEEAISRAPLVSVEIDRRRREYENAQALYERAADNLEEARFNLRIIDGNRAERITLVEAASVPRNPASPNRKLIAVMGGMVGIALAGGLFVLLEILNRTIRRPAEITRKLGITPLTTIPYIDNSRERFWRSVRWAAALLLVTVGLPAGMYAVHTYYMPLDLLADMVLSRIGLA